jgi:hypothetical protein
MLAAALWHVQAELRQYAVVPLPYTPYINVAPREAALIVHKILQMLQIRSLQNVNVLRAEEMRQRCALPGRQPSSIDSGECYAHVSP